MEFKQSYKLVYLCVTWSMRCCLNIWLHRLMMLRRLCMKGLASTENHMSSTVVVCSIGRRGGGRSLGVSACLPISVGRALYTVQFSSIPPSHSYMHFTCMHGFICRFISLILSRSPLVHTQYTVKKPINTCTSVYTFSEVLSMSWLQPYLKVSDIHVYLFISVDLFFVLLQSGRGVGHPILSSSFYFFSSQHVAIQEKLVQKLLPVIYPQVSVTLKWVAIFNCLQMKECVHAQKKYIAQDCNS